MVNGTYASRSYLGVSGADMDCFTAQEIGSTVTCGWRLGAINPDGHSDGKLRVDMLIALNDTRIKNGDDLMRYLEINSLPGETIRVQRARTRPPPPP